jgi:hypothetical protein
MVGFISCCIGFFLHCLYLFLYFATAIIGFDPEDELPSNFILDQKPKFIKLNFNKINAYLV